MGDVVTLEREGHVAIVTLRRPEARNALNPQMLVQLARAWRSVRDDPQIRAAVVTGHGDKAFCSGADLGRLIPLMSGGRAPEDEWDRQVVEDRDILGTALLRTFDAGKPVIAAINGHAIAGGMELVQGTDLRIAANSAKLHFRRRQHLSGRDRPGNSSASRGQGCSDGRRAQQGLGRRGEGRRSNQRRLRAERSTGQGHTRFRGGASRNLQTTAIRRFCGRAPAADDGQDRAADGARQILARRQENIRERGERGWLDCARTASLS